MLRLHGFGGENRWIDTDRGEKALGGETPAPSGTMAATNPTVMLFYNLSRLTL